MKKETTVTSSLKLSAISFEGAIIPFYALNIATINLLYQIHMACQTKTFCILINIFNNIHDQSE